MDLSFSGAGFMGCYYFGVVNCWNKYIPRQRVHRVAGASAGSLIAAYYLMDLPLEACLKEIIELTEDVRSRPLGVFDRSNQIVDVLPRKLHAMFPDDAHKRVSGRLHVCMTRLRDMKCVIVNEFDTKKDLIDALNCSCFIPVWSGNHVSTYKGVKYIDGGFTNNLPVFDEHTVRVSCFSGASDIAPYDRAHMGELMMANVQGMPVNLTWKNLRRAGRALWPPPPSYIVGLLERGFHDTKDFILSNDLIQCASCFKGTQLELQPIYQRVSPTISPAASPSVSRASSFMNLSDMQRADSFRRRSSSSKRRSPPGSDAGRAGKLAHPKPHRQQAAHFGAKRSKSGKQIQHKALQRPRTKDEEAAAAATKPGFGVKLLEKLQRVAARRQDSEPVVMPTIVVDEAAADDEPQSQEEESDEKRLVSILDILKEQQTDDELGPALRRSVAGSASSATSNDSAVCSDGPSLAPEAQAQHVLSGSPAEKYYSSKAGAASAAGAGETLLLADRFSSAPSPLPSCPPSPNLNRHCTECIGLRQLARLDGLDDSIRRQAELYGGIKSKEPEKEFGTLRYRLTSWFRQLGSPRYFYAFDECDGQAEAESDERAAARARRKASLAAGPAAGEIPTY